MVLRCPQCGMIGGHDRSAFFGNWVVCPSCERPFEWREARVTASRAPTPESTETKSETESATEEERRKKKMKALRRMIYSLIAVTSLGASAGSAQAADQEQALVITATNLMASDARHQEVARNGGDAQTLFPGDVVLYRLVFTNVTASEVRNVEFVDPLPAGLQYVGQTAAADRDDVVIEYSADRGQTYSQQPMVQEIVDGERVMRPATPDEYTHIRWRIEGSVQPGAQVTAEFRAELPSKDETKEPGK